MNTQIVRTVTPGQRPGSLSSEVQQEVDQVCIHVISFGPDRLEESEVETVQDAFEIIERTSDWATVTWIDVVGLHDKSIFEQLGKKFGVHELALEDTHNAGQRPKAEIFEDHILVILRRLHFEEVLDVEQVSLFFGKRVLVSLQERPGDPFDPIRERLRDSRGRIRQSRADYLAYSLIDAVVDSQYPVLEKYGEWIESMESEVMKSPSPETLEIIQRIKRDLLWMRRCAWPHRELVKDLDRSESTLISEETRPYLRDCYDHCVQLMDVVETFRDLAGGLNDLYLSSASHRMNEVMKVLTIMASIFIPLTFIAGIYGMNFNPEASAFNMPELNWLWGYPMALGLMGIIGLGMVFFFKRRRWF